MASGFRSRAWPGSRAGRRPGAMPGGPSCTSTFWSMTWPVRTSGSSRLAAPSGAGTSLPGLAPAARRSHGASTGKFCQPGLSPVRRRSRQHLAARHQRPRPASTGAALVLSWTDRIPDRSLRAWLRLTNDFRIAPRVRREDREIRLFSRVLALNEQETASGDAESVRFFVGQLAVPCRGAEIDLDSHDRQPFERGRYSILTILPSWAVWFPKYNL